MLDSRRRIDEWIVATDGAASGAASATEGQKDGAGDDSRARGAIPAPPEWTGDGDNERAADLDRDRSP